MADILLIVVILTNLLLVATSRINACIQLMAVQGVLLGFFALCSSNAHLSTEVLIITGTAIVLKGYAFPKLLFRSVKNVNVRREVEPFVGYVASIFVGLVVLGISLHLGANLVIPTPMSSTLTVPATLFSIFVGLFLIVSRKKAITQVVGYLIMDNGIYTLGAGALPGTPMLVELGILLDLLVVVFLMGITINSINRTFNHIDVHELRRLQG